MAADKVRDLLVRKVIMMADGTVAAILSGLDRPVFAEARG